MLIGKTIVIFKIADDRKALLFVTSDGENLIAKADADCCSETWIESVELPALGLPFTISAVEDLELNVGQDTRDGELEFYGAKIVTDKGDLVIDYRNESNGYYGGSLCWPGDDNFYGGVYAQNVPSENWIEVPDAG